MRHRPSHVHNFLPGDRLASGAVAELYAMVSGVAAATVSIDLDAYAVVLFVVVVVVLHGAVIGFQLMSPASGFTSRLVPFKLVCVGPNIPPMNNHKNRKMGREKNDHKICNK